MEGKYLFLTCILTQLPGSPFTNMVLLFSQHGKVITCLVKCRMKILTHSKTSSVAPLMFGNG